MTTASPPILDYLPPPAPSEYDLELLWERTRWLRKRFIWLCALNIFLELAFFLGFSADFRQAPTIARLFTFINLVIQIGGYLFALVYVIRTRPSLAALLKLGLYVTAILPSLSILFTRADISLNRASWDFMDPTMSSGVIWAIMSPTSIFLFYLIACIFIPWTFREALRPAAVILLANSAVIVADLLFTIKTPDQRIVAGICLGFSLLSVLPGLFICWWRFSRFRKRFRLTYESSGYRKLQHELAGARRVHESSLPPQNLLTTGPVRLAYVYEPMRQIGGDILFVHPADDPEAPVLSVLLVDVNGHGFGAALMANRLIGEIQRLFAEDPDASPHQVLCALNRYVRLTMAKTGVFATALCLRIDTRAGTLQLANGGHPPAFLRKSDGAIVRLEPDTYLLGVVDGDDYCPACQTVPFHPGDALLAYTDGATEARDFAGKMVTISGLYDRFGQLTSSPDRWPQALLHQITSHRRAPAEDDTLLAAIYRV
jgi:hypothetical protein